MISRAVLIYLKQVSELRPALGQLVLTAGSQHIYDRHFENSKGVIDEECQKTHGVYADPAMFNDVDTFVKYLWLKASDA